MFLIAKSTKEIHEKLEGEDGEVTKRIAPTFASVIFQIMMLDIVFSLDSVITAVGMVQQIGVMIAAVIVAMIVMLIFVNQISDFVARHPTIKMLALSFLILIGVMLVAEAFHQKIPKGYIYFAMAFSVGVEMLNIRLRKVANASNCISLTGERVRFRIAGEEWRRHALAGCGGLCWLARFRNCTSRASPGSRPE